MAAPAIMNVARSGGTVSCINAGSKVMFTTTYPDGVQMAEELHGVTHELLVRKWKAPAMLGKAPVWHYEIGDPTTVAEAAASTTASAAAAATGGAALRPAASNPVMVCRETPKAFMWRIRNLPYTEEVYMLSVDDSAQLIVLRTTNKKYYRQIPVPGMARAGCALDEADLSHSHANNTLVITYAKPEAVLTADAKAAEARETAAGGSAAGGEACKQQ